MLVAFEVPDDERPAFEGFLSSLGYRFQFDENNDAYHRFLGGAAAGLVQLISICLISGAVWWQNDGPAPCRSRQRRTSTEQIELLRSAVEALAADLNELTSAVGVTGEITREERARLQWRTQQVLQSHQGDCAGQDGSRSAKRPRHTAINPARAPGKRRSPEPQSCSIFFSVSLNTFATSFVPCSGTEACELAFIQDDEPERVERYPSWEAAQARWREVKETFKDEGWAGPLGRE